MTIDILIKLYFILRIRRAKPIINIRDLVFLVHSNFARETLPPVYTCLSNCFLFSLRRLTTHANYIRSALIFSLSFCPSLSFHGFQILNGLELERKLVVVVAYLLKEASCSAIPRASTHTSLKHKSSFSY